MNMPDWYANIRLPLLFLQAVGGMLLFAYPPCAAGTILCCGQPQAFARLWC